MKGAIVLRPDDGEGGRRLLGEVGVTEGAVKPSLVGVMHEGVPAPEDKVLGDAAGDGLRLSRDAALMSLVTIVEEDDSVSRL